MAKNYTVSDLSTEVFDNVNRFSIIRESIKKSLDRSYSTTTLVTAIHKTRPVYLELHTMPMVKK